MMLQNDFYHIIETKYQDNILDVELKFNETHPIFLAHFPQHPITPGVCIIQICKELLSAHYQCSLTMATAKNIKFLNVLKPVASSSVHFKITSSCNSDGLIKAHATVENNDTCFAKISSSYQKG